MRKLQNTSLSEISETMNRGQLSQLLGGCGAATAQRIAREAGAVIKVGRRTLFSVPKIRRWLDAQSQ